MKIHLALLCSFTLVFSAAADEAASRQNAKTILDLSNTEETTKVAFKSTIDAMIANMKRSGMPEAAAQEMSTEMTKWFNTEFKWAELEPKIVELYVKHFTEQELKALVDFYQTPTGKKLLEKLPVIITESSKVGQEYVASKEGTLKTIVQGIIEKYRPKPQP